ncbi:MAG TPA: pyridoxal 5'-phosphate synthase glutaminase subunit PdxT [Blastocatellia bacterium]|nr:pyridoxal 5'-phosphate synthase glutaminase subunit PdxT [Blastocatellia bacterium]
MKIGVLALQGDFAAHARMLGRLGAEAVEVRDAASLESVEALVIPGGESSTMLKLITDESLTNPITDFARSGRPVFGTCAGAILLARRVRNPEQPSLNLIDIDVARNAYGRQVDSFVAAVDTELDGGPLEAVFIRAPRITGVGPGVEVLASHRGEPVLVRSGSIMAGTFHPELTDDTRVHRLLVEQVRGVTIKHDAHIAPAV